MVGNIDTSRIVPDLIASGVAIMLDRGMASSGSTIWLAASYVVAKILYRMIGDSIMNSVGTSGDYGAVMALAINIFVTGVIWHYVAEYVAKASLPITEAVLLAGFATPLSLAIKM